MPVRNQVLAIQKKKVPITVKKKNVLPILLIPVKNVVVKVLIASTEIPAKENVNPHANVQPQYSYLEMSLLVLPPSIVGVN